MITVKTFIFSPFQENTYVVYDESGKGIIIDAGCYDEQEKQIITLFLEQNKIEPILLLSTHGHLDHNFGNKFLMNTYNLPLYAHQADARILSQAGVFAGIYGYEMEDSPVISHEVIDGETIHAGNTEWIALHLPGHSPGSLAFWQKEQKIVFVGDVLFNGSIGRSDLPGGNFDTLIHSIKQKLFSLPDDTIVYCGHGPTTTIGNERKTNPFLK